MTSQLPANRPSPTRSLSPSGTTAVSGEPSTLAAGVQVQTPPPRPSGPQPGRPVQTPRTLFQRFQAPGQSPFRAPVRTAFGPVTGAPLFRRLVGLLGGLDPGRLGRWRRQLRGEGQHKGEGCEDCELPAPPYTPNSHGAAACEVSQTRDRSRDDQHPGDHMQYC